MILAVRRLGSSGSVRAQNEGGRVLAFRGIRTGAGPGSAVTSPARFERLGVDEGSYPNVQESGDNRIRKVAGREFSVMPIYTELLRTTWTHAIGPRYRDDAGWRSGEWVAEYGVNRAVVAQPVRASRGMRCSSSPGILSGSSVVKRRKEAA